MPLEIEAKMKVADHAAVQMRLSACGATLLGQTLETNQFYDTSDRALLAADQGLRLRTTSDVGGATGPVTITFKGPCAAGPLKRREEIELTVSSAAGATELLARLGYHLELAFEKRRQSWLLDSCRVELDELPELGRFVEIEGPDEEAVLHVRARLGLTVAPLIKAPYIAMVAEALAQRGDGARALTFA